MAEYQLYCFAQSGNSYRAALMLKLIGADWQPVFVDFFRGGVQRSADYRTNINEMGEAPVLVHGDKKLTQSGVILTYLAERSGKFQPRSEDDRLEALRWIIFYNQKVSGYIGPYRFLRTLAKPAIRRCWNSSRGESTTCSEYWTSGSPAAATSSGRSRPSPTSRSSATSTTRRRNSAST